jgi:hypothetical protein
VRAVLLASALAVACGPGDKATKNPPVLYMAPLDSELDVQLIDHDPPPF